MLEIVEGRVMDFQEGFLWSAVNLSKSCKQRDGEPLIAAFVIVNLESTGRFFWGSHPVMLICITCEHANCQS